MGQGVMRQVGSNWVNVGQGGTMKKRKWSEVGKVGDARRSRVRWGKLG